ncbi:MAG: GLUG motif-containing protein, partial [Fibrobacter sp.]|nr:GLUG motif-containing protein [Fibrobacter sp.]
WFNKSGWIPIGDLLNPFTGTYNGKGKIIENLFIDKPESDYVGLFGMVGKGGSIDSLGLTNVSINAGSNTGSLVGYNDSASISSCYSVGQVKGLDYVGGLIGKNSGIVSRCKYNRIVSGQRYVGGLAGYNTCVINSCYNTSDVWGIDGYIGGLVGHNDSATISNCYSIGDVNYGELIILREEDVKIVYIDNNTQDLDMSDVSMLKKAMAAPIPGGLGGLAGENSGSIINCYCIGNVRSGYFTGGLVGGVLSYSGTIENSFWERADTDTAVSEYGTAKTAKEMKKITTYLSAGWDFMDETKNGKEDIWGINPVNNSSYPFLKWQGFENDLTTSVLKRDTTQVPKTVSVSKGIYIRSNPVSLKDGAANIRVVTNKGANLKVNIYNAVGDLVFQTSRLSSTGIIDFTWNLKTRTRQTADAGTYLVVAKVQNRSGMSETLKAKLGLKR